MLPPRGSAAYKKKDGTLALSKDLQSVSWTPTMPPGAKPTVALAVSGITNLQQTPASLPKVMLKIFTQSPSAPVSETHVFVFTSVTGARAEADAIKDALSKAIQASKTGFSTPATPGGSSAAMAIASAISSGKGSGEESWYSDESLKTNIELHQSLLKANPSLSKTFMESLRTKPEAISNSQFTSQFWASRLHLLRAHAIERSQMRGSYNVLSTIKPKNEDNTIKLSISKEQIQLIFSQHPLVKRVYDENVPKLSEENFWSRFFQSRLFKKLKGERITDVDPPDGVLDKYLSHSDELERNQRLLASHIPHIIDLAGNEENHSQRQGNAPDYHMRPTAAEHVPIIRTLNSLSEKIMSHVAPNDVDPSEPIGMDEETFNSLALRDLQGDAEENRIILDIKDQSRFFSSDKENDISSEARRYATQDPNQVLRDLLADLDLGSKVDLGFEIGVDDDSSDSEPEDEAPRDSHMGSKSSLRKASAQIFAAIADQRAQDDDLSMLNFNTIGSASTCGLTGTVFDRLSLTHATTTEFLHHFWKAFLSGDSARAEEVAKLVETLDRAMDRIKAVADDAEMERTTEIENAKEKVRDHYSRTHRKLAFNPDAIKGGAKTVNQLMAPTVEAIRIATGKYQQALQEENGS